MKKRIFSVLFAVVLVLSFSLVTLGPMATPALAAIAILIMLKNIAKSMTEESAGWKCRR